MNSMTVVFLILIGIGLAGIYWVKHSKHFKK
jgi:hypothetical protein